MAWSLHIQKSSPSLGSTAAAAPEEDLSSQEGERQLQGVLRLFVTPSAHTFIFFFPKQFWFVDCQASRTGNSFFLVTGEMRRLWWDML